MKYKLFAWPVGSGIASLAILILVVLPQMFAYMDTRDQISSIESRSNSLEVKAQGLEQIDEASTKKNLQLVMAVLPVEMDVPKAMGILQDLVKNSGLDLRHSGYISSQKSAQGDSFQLSVTVVGQITAVRNFLISLQDSPQVFQIGAIRVKFKKSESAVEADIPISAFYQSASIKNAVSPASSVPQLSDNEEQLLSRLAKVVEINQSGSVSTSSANFSGNVPLGKLNPFE